MAVELLTTISRTLDKKTVIELASLHTSAFTAKDLIDLSFNTNQQIGFRAAWILEQIYSNHNERFLPHTRYFLDRLCKQKNLSALRHFVKIFAFMTDKKARAELKEILDDFDLDQVVSTVFSWLIEENIPVAVKAHCLDILSNLSVKQPWIKPELLETMDYLISKESIAFFARVKKVRKRL